ncbi:MAG: dephospho-CoA kinase [Chloroflexota bacterium]|nr:dephospho-CoA kinase [Chloroflexota bacterium]MDE3193937.1 dephospho-CoA kinase [Chloroflexota bacterium]
MTAYVIGLTGQMGAGKTTVAQMLRELGAKVLDADAIVHQEQSRGTVGYSAIVQRFGTGVLGEDREIDRAKLAEQVFADPRKLAELERILHPRVVARVLEARSMLPDGGILVIEAIKLLESALRSACDEVWVVVAPHDVLLERLRGRGVPAAEAEARLRHQRSEADFRANGNVVIENGADREATRQRARSAYETARAKASAKASRAPGSGT